MSISDDTIKSLITSNEEVSESSKELAIAIVEYQERARLARVRFNMTMIAFLILVLAMVVSILIVSVGNTTIRNDIKNCVTPTGKCYQDNLTYAIAINICAAQGDPGLPFHQKVVAVRKCADKLVGNNGK